MEVNSETDFVARDENFLGFVATVADTLYQQRSAELDAITSGDIEEARQALVQKIGENIYENLKLCDFPKSTEISQIKEKRTETNNIDVIFFVVRRFPLIKAAPI